MRFLNCTNQSIGDSRVRVWVPKMLIFPHVVR